MKKLSAAVIIATLGLGFSACAVDGTLDCQTNEHGELVCDGESVGIPGQDSERYDSSRSICDNMSTKTGQQMMTISEVEVDNDNGTRRTTSTVMYCDDDGNSVESQCVRITDKDTGEVISEEGDC